MSEPGAAAPMAPAAGQPDYSTWSSTSLIARITELERQLHSRTAEFTPASAPAPPQEAAPSVAQAGSQKKPADDITRTPAPNKPPKVAREIDPSKYNTRFIALKFAYLGQRYNGLEHANGNTTPLPTIEEELYKALRKTHLIFPTGATSEDLKELIAPREVKQYTLNWEGCDYSKGGRTDRGVSAFGQVVGIRVRSARPRQKKSVAASAAGADENMDTTEGSKEVVEEAADDGWDDIADELPYVNMLNRVLPEDIRVLAWCPHPPEGFDARFSCRERQYKYFFTQPAFSPTPGPGGFAPRASDKADTPAKYREGWLDIDAMREAARMFVGTQDFRNFCKLDTSKQIENFERIIYHADIELVDPRSTPLGYVTQPGFKGLEDESADQASEAAPNTSAAQVYVFHLQGSAFLWHQVRHMVSVLFLVGQGLEPPSIVADLLDVSKNPRKPSYEMASDAPLVLWDCVYPDEASGSRADSLEWVYAGDPRQAKSQLGKGNSKFGLGGVVDGLWSVWRQRKIDEILAGSLLDLAISQGDQSIVTGETPSLDTKHRGQKVFYGADEARTGGPYIPIMQKRKLDPVEVQNARWLASKQRKTAEKANRMEM